MAKFSVLFYNRFLRFFGWLQNIKGSSGANKKSTFEENEERKFDAKQFNSSPPREIEQGCVV